MTCQDAIAMHIEAQARGLLLVLQQHNATTSACTLLLGIHVPDSLLNDSLTISL